jgi:DnaJ-class molecular chaperone
VSGCHTCGGYGMRHDPIAHGTEPTWLTCPRCKGDGCVRDRFDMDVTCPDCDGDGGREP